MLKAYIGFKGEKGQDGTSATLDVTKSGGVTTVTATDYRGTTTTNILDGEITKAMIVDNLTSTDTDAPLSANQGKALNDSITTLNTTVSNIPKFYSGTTEPSSSLGNDGDIYFKYVA